MASDQHFSLKYFPGNDLVSNMFPKKSSMLGRLESMGSYQSTQPVGYLI